MDNTKSQAAILSMQNLLRIVYFIVPVAAGIDKFTNLLTDWSQYPAPFMVDLLPFSPETFMMIVGVIEIIAGFIVLFRPRIGSAIVAIWLVSIALNLLLSGRYLDVAVRDLVMAITAWVLFKLTQVDHIAKSKAVRS